MKVRWLGPKTVRVVTDKAADVWFYTTGKTVEFVVRPIDENGTPILRKPIRFKVRRESTVRT